MSDWISNSKKMVDLQQSLQEGDSLVIEDLWDSPKALIASLAQVITGKNLLIITGASQEEAKLYHNFPFFTDRQVLDFPFWETLPTENVSPSPDIVGDRYQSLELLSTSNQTHIVLASLTACLQKIIPPEQFRKLSVTLSKGDSFVFEDLIKNIEKMGYQKRFIASDKGEFAIRGGIIDLFPVSSPDPFRIEFWGNEIESIRTYDPIGQTSIRQVEKVAITAALELELIEKSSTLTTLLAYLGENTIVIFDDLLAIEDRYATLITMIEGKASSFTTMESFLQEIDSLQKIFLTKQPLEELNPQLQKMPTFLPSMQEVTFEMFHHSFTMKRWLHPFQTILDYFSIGQEEMSGEEIIHALPLVEENKAHLTVLCSTELEESSFHKKILQENVTLPKNTTIQMGYLSSGFAILDAKRVIFPLTEITHRYKIRRQKHRSTYHTAPVESYDLNVGDLVVHLHQGIGRYLGLERRLNNNGVMSDFLVLEYAESAKLFVPLHQSHLVSKYIGASSEMIPKLHTMGSSRWKKTYDQTQTAILGYAKELLSIYAKREITGGFVFQEDSQDMLSFEEEFPFEETEDQLSAIASIKADMCSKKTMDRLICGDVGYGKTEVAMRAAFKAVIDGQKQVAVLVPTTVLAMQHYETFMERMANFPVTIGTLSRFISAKETRNTIEGVASGAVDILIGTHRIISEDIHFKDLGLVIIDEEQRFGVKAKEHLKKIKASVDCLTLSATPIPRTLYMSLIGARDLSMINTPPQDRLPIKTIITEASDQVLKSALQRELARDGQAYVIHNRVETIFDMASRIKKLVPDAKVVVAHGQMHSDEIDNVFHAFKSGRANILIATSIVENGIDIPLANTIMIDRADRFGLADLYQLRGRVGRWNRRAYAYFLVPKLTTMPEITRQRLNALAMSSGYGGGMKIAMADLQIRGAGHILGEEQSGHVIAIGFPLYCKLLKKAVHALQGKIPISIYETKIDSTIDARIPDSYINEVSLRMEIYHRLGEATSKEEIDGIETEMQDRFGREPLEAQWLFVLSRIRIIAAQKQIHSIKIEKLSVTIERQKKGETIVRKLLLPPKKSPGELEAHLLKILNESI